MYGVVVYFIMGLKAEKVGVFLVGMSLFSIASTAVFIFLGMLANHVGVANVFSVVALLRMMVFGGFLLNLDSLTGAVAWVKYFSMFYYAFEVLMANELHSLKLDSSMPHFTSVDGVDGDLYLNVLGFKHENTIDNMLCLSVLSLGWLYVAYILAFHTAS